MQVSKINDIALTMTFELYFDLMWEESRFVINTTSDKWGQVLMDAMINIYSDTWARHS
jgi:hypothetical protein